jgi:hypothetical protein
MTWDDENRQACPTGRTSRLGTLVFPFLGFIAFELTLNPLLGVLVACMKPALEDGKTALWILRTDPKRARGWTCGFMFLAAGFWKTFAWSFLLGILLTMASEGVGGGAVMRQSQAGTFVAMLLGFLILLLSSALAVGSSLLSGPRVWISRDVHQARRENFWPPSALVRPEAHNQVDVLVMPMLLALCLSLVMMILLSALAMGNAKVEGVMAFSVIASMIGGSALILLLRDAITRRMVADSASACWPPDEAAPIPEVDEFGMPRRR